MTQTITVPAPLHRLQELKAKYEAGGLLNVVDWAADVVDCLREMEKPVKAGPISQEDQEFLNYWDAEPPVGPTSTPQSRMMAACFRLQRPGGGAGVSPLLLYTLEALASVSEDMSQGREPAVIRQEVIRAQMLLAELDGSL